MMVARLNGCTAVCSRCVDLVPGTVFGIGPGQYCGSFFWQLDFPTIGQNAENAEGPAGTEPAFSYFLKVLDAMYNVALRILLR
jgi:hypothetical protein